MTKISYPAQERAKKIHKVTDASTISGSDTTSSRSFQVQRLGFRRKPAHDTPAYFPYPLQRTSFTIRNFLTVLFFI
jgi:hypothetical protein